MKWMIAIVGLCAIAAGSWWGWISWSIVQLERGWSGFIASSVVVSAGLLLLGLAAVMARVDALNKTMRGVTATLAENLAEQLADNRQAISHPGNASTIAADVVRPPTIERPVAPPPGSVFSSNGAVPVSAPVSAPVAAVAGAAVLTGTAAAIAARENAVSQDARDAVANAILNEDTPADSNEITNGSSETNEDSAGALTRKPELESNSGMATLSGVASVAAGSDDLVGKPAEANEDGGVVEEGARVSPNPDTQQESASADLDGAALVVEDSVPVAQEEETASATTVTPIPPRRDIEILTDWPAAPGNADNASQGAGMQELDSVKQDRADETMNDTLEPKPVEPKPAVPMPAADLPSSFPGSEDVSDRLSGEPFLQRPLPVPAVTPGLAGVRNLAEALNKSDSSITIATPDELTAAPVAETADEILPFASDPQAEEIDAIKDASASKDGSVPPKEVAGKDEQDADGFEADLRKHAGKASPETEATDDNVVHVDSEGTAGVSGPPLPNGTAASSETSGDNATAIASDPEPSAPDSVQEKPPLLRSYESQGINYFLYTDGSIEAQTPAGLLHFASLQELRTYIEHRTG